jgi:hypothetical protein
MVPVRELVVPSIEYEVPVSGVPAGIVTLMLPPIVVVQAPTESDPDVTCRRRTPLSPTVAVRLSVALSSPPSVENGIDEPAAMPAKLSVLGISMESSALSVLSLPMRTRLCIPPDDATPAIMQPKVNVPLGRVAVRLPVDKHGSEPSNDGIDASKPGKPPVPPDPGLCASKQANDSRHMP